MKKYIIFTGLVSMLSLLLVCCHLLPNQANNETNTNTSTNTNTGTIGSDTNTNSDPDLNPDGNNEPDTSTHPTPSTKPLFTAFGAEPFWSVRIAESGIQLTSLAESIDTVHYPFVAAESVVGRPKEFAHIFRVTDVENPITVVLQKSFQEKACWCTDGMSDNYYEYDVTVLRKNQIWMGCGRAGE